MSALTIEHEIRTLGENFGTAEFWGVSVDGNSIATNARTFTASDAELVLSECEYCYHCGVPVIAVRRTSNDHIVWFVDCDEAYTPTIGADFICEFDRVGYEELLGGDTGLLPEISTQDLELILTQIALPRWEDAIYTIPHLPNDKFGKKTLRVINDAVAQNRVVPHTNCVADPSVLRIGIDVERIPETELLISQENNETIFRFAELPNLPIWCKISDDPNPFLNILLGSEIS
ncbi:MAG: hypothetical protein AB8B55_16070 [Mariniblastus sp.]